MGKTAGFTVGWMVWVTSLAGWAILRDGFVGYLGTLWAPARVYETPIIVGPVALLCLFNTLGVRLGSCVIGFFTVAKLIPLTLLIVAGLTFAGVPGNVALELVPLGSGDFFGAVLLIIFAYGGFEDSSEQVFVLLKATQRPGEYRRRASRERPPGRPSQSFRPGRAGR
jgi:basic amino acid/polyamine antiporter, APA family